jgi:hypothetical protein
MSRNVVKDCRSAFGPLARPLGQSLDQDQDIKSFAALLCKQRLENDPTRCEHNEAGAASQNVLPEQPTPALPTTPAGDAAEVAATLASMRPAATTWNTIGTMGLPAGWSRLPGREDDGESRSNSITFVSSDRVFATLQRDSELKMPTVAVTLNDGHQSAPLEVTAASEFTSILAADLCTGQTKHHYKELEDKPDKFDICVSYAQSSAADLSLASQPLFCGVVPGAN